MTDELRFKKIFRACFDFLMQYDGKSPQDYNWDSIAEHCLIVCAQFNEDKLLSEMMSDCVGELERKWKASRKQH